MGRDLAKVELINRALWAIESPLAVRFDHHHGCHTFHATSD